MGQTSYIYILWIVILVAGLWIIMGFGTLLHAREDLAGQWELTPEKPAAGEKTSALWVEQSGRYLNLTLPDIRPLRMKMIDERVIDERFGEQKRIVLSGDGLTAIFEGRTGGDLWRLSLHGKVDGDFIARLNERTYPKPQPAVRKASLSPADAR